MNNTDELRAVAEQRFDDKIKDQVEQMDEEYRDSNSIPAQIRLGYDVAEAIAEGTFGLSAALKTPLTLLLTITTIPTISSQWLKTNTISMKKKLLVKLKTCYVLTLSIKTKN